MLIFKQKKKLNSDLNYKQNIAKINVQNNVNEMEKKNGNVD